jgi:signal transduction histidine kinase
MNLEEGTGELVMADELLERVFSSIDLLIAYMDKEFNFIRVNKAYAEADEQKPEYFVGKNHFALYPSKDNEVIFRKVVETGEPVFFYGKPFVYAEHPERGMTYWDWSLQPVKGGDGKTGGVVLSLINVTDRMEMQRRTNATHYLLHLFTQKTSRKDYLEAVVHLIRDWSKCRCAGIRVLDEQRQIPYESYEGFKEDFWRAENWLSIDHDQCVCIRVMIGKLDPQDVSVITPAGSFCCNDTSKFIENLSDKEKARYRGVCIEAGFTTVVVIPIRYRDEIVGAIHLADERRDMAPLGMVEFLESLTPLIGEAILRFNLETELHRNYETQKAINSLLSLSLENISLQAFLERTLGIMISNPMISPEARGCIFIAEPGSDVLVMKAQYGLPDSIKKACARVPSGTCLCGRIALTKQIQYTDYLNDCHEFPVEGIPPHSHYHVPILFGNRLLGMVTLYLREGDRPTQEKEAFLTAITNALATIILRKEWEEALRESENRLRLLSNQLLTAQENERKQIARDLHDGVGQMLSAIKFKIESVIQPKDKGKGKFEDPALQQLVPLIRESIEEVRRIQMDLRPSVLDDLGIIATIGWFTREFEKVYSAISIQKQIDIREDEIPVPLKIVLYRIIQEALNNIAKHSRANRAIIALMKKEGSIELTVEDNGAGFDLENRPRGFGLGSMRERIELSGGIFMIESAIGHGTTIHASWTLS